MKMLNPVFYERTKDGEVFYDVQSRLIKDRVIFISEEITSELAGTVASLLFMLNNENKEEKISIWLNTPGGDVYGFFAIYDMMQMIQAPVETVCVGSAMSAGALLLAAGSKGRRFCTPNAKLMIHQVQVDRVRGTGTHVAIEAKEISNMKQKMAEIFACHTGQSYERVVRDCENDTYLTADQALKYGIVDYILPIAKEIPPLYKTDNDKPKKTTKKAVSKKVGKARK